MPAKREPVAGPSSERFERLIAPPRPRSFVAGILVAVAGGALVSAFSALHTLHTTAVPALMYLLVVIAAAVAGTFWSGMAAAALSFAGLDFFFTPPAHTLAVSKAEDLAALGIFLAVGALVSGGISAILRQRTRAEVREHQVRALYHVSTRLLSGAALQAVLGHLAASLRALYELEGCRVVVLGPDGSERLRVEQGSMTGEIVEVPLQSGGATVGMISLAGAVGGTPGGAEREVLQTFAGQLALALERARLGEEAADARLEADTSRTRAALFSSVTHDLRTPLASIMTGASSLLEEGVPFSDDQRQDLLRTILEEAQRLDRLVGNLMDLSRLRAGALTPSVESVFLEDLASSVVARLRDRLGGRTVRLHIREDAPAVRVDVVQMDQVFTNVLENAVRFSPPGSEITVTGVRWERSVEIRVSDRGPGIRPEDHQRVFDEFFSRDVGESKGGTGLGLAIARAIVTAHGGTMWVEETRGGGATIGWRLPLAASPVRPALTGGRRNDGA